MSPRASSSAIVSALIMPRSATTQTRLTRKRRCKRSIAGIRLPTSAVFPGHISVHTGRNHLVQVRPMVLGEAAPTERLAARALEIEARRIHEYDVERGQQIAPMGEKLLLQDILHAARRKRRRAVLLVFGKLLAEPRHGAIKMVQFEPIDPFDAIILAPAVGGAIRTAAKQAMQHGQERRTLQREVMFSPARQALDHASAARLFPQPLERQRRPEAPGRDNLRLAAIKRVEHNRLVGKSRPRAQQPLQLPTFPQLVDPPQGGDNLLAYRRPLTPTFDDLQIGAACRGLPAEMHTGEPRDDSIVVRTASPCTQLQSIEKCIDRGTTLSQPPPIAINNINDLDSATPCNCRSSV